MALQDIVRKQERQYECRLFLDPKYAPLIKRGVNLNDQCKKSEFSKKRIDGPTNVDLWVDGKLYPIDPRTLLPPPFTSLKELVGFVCEGQNGFLGYVSNLTQGRDLNLIKEIENLKLKNVELCSEIQRLEKVNLTLHSKIESLQTLVARDENDIHNKQVEYETTLQQKEEELQELKEKQAKQFSRCLTQKRKDLSELSQKGGHAQRLKRKLRQLLQAETTKKLHSENITSRKKQRLCGNFIQQEGCASVLTTLLTKREKTSMLQQPNMANAVMNATNEVFKKIGSHVNEEAILSTCDKVGVSQKGYAEIQKTMQRGLREVHQNLRLHVLPNAHKVTKLRRELNSKLPDYIGNYYSLHVELPDDFVSTKQQNKDTTKPRKITLNENNSLFVDIEAVQQSIVKFYNITQAKTNGKPLIFVLKLDEAEIVKNQKLERVSITLMNRTLDPTIQKDDAQYFSVQADQEIWPVACFQVSKESHAQLKFIFSQTKFPEIIQAQEFNAAL